MTPQLSSLLCGSPLSGSAAPAKGGDGFGVQFPAVPHSHCRDSALLPPLLRHGGGDGAWEQAWEGVGDI